MIDIIKSRMREKGINQAAMARQSGIEKGNISRILTGKISPSLATLTKITEVLKIKMRDLFPADHPDITGFIEYNGTIHKVSSFEDIENILKLKK